MSEIKWFLLLLAAIIPHDNKHYREWSRKVFVGYSFYPCKIQSSKSGFQVYAPFWANTYCMSLPEIPTELLSQNQSSFLFHDLHN